MTPPKYYDSVASPTKMTVTEFYLPKIGASFSIFGSIIIIAELESDWKVKETKGRTPISLILFSMSIGDILFSA